jgi:ketosteroid isomerase-like protein
MKLNLILSFVLLSATLIFSQSKEELSSQIEKLNKLYSDAMINNDTKTMMSLYTDDVVSLPSYQPMIRGIETLRNLSEQVENSEWKTTSFEMKTTDLIPADNFIIEIGNYKMKMVGPGVPDWSDEGKYITIWKKKEDGNLKIRVEMWNTDLNPFLEMRQSNQEEN